MKDVMKAIAKFLSHVWRSFLRSRLVVEMPERAIRVEGLGRQPQCPDASVVRHGKGQAAKKARGA
jgi:hypothetical protein